MRVRAGLVDPEFRKLMGIVEVDETFIGGKSKNKHVGERLGRRGTDGKLIVIGAVERKGSVVARVIRNTDNSTIQGFVREAVSTKVDLVATDDYRAYRGLKEFNHGVVHHSLNEYVVGAVHTQTIEGFWSLIKRGIMGTYHKVSAKYLPPYVAEFEFRYNNRKNADIFGAAVARC
jgi:transposase-like protein